LLRSPAAGEAPGFHDRSGDHEERQGQQGKVGAAGEKVLRKIVGGGDRIEPDQDEQGNEDSNGDGTPRNISPKITRNMIADAIMGLPPFPSAGAIPELALA
jgi:hypothetical protein